MASSAHREVSTHTCTYTPDSSAPCMVKGRLEKALLLPIHLSLITMAIANIISVIGCHQSHPLRLPSLRFLLLHHRFVHHCLYPADSGLENSRCSRSSGCNFGSDLCCHWNLCTCLSSRGRNATLLSTRVC